VTWAEVSPAFSAENPSTDWKKIVTGMKKPSMPKATAALTQM